MRRLAFRAHYLARTERELLSESRTWCQPAPGWDLGHPIGAKNCRPAPKTVDLRARELHGTLTQLVLPSREKETMGSQTTALQVTYLPVTSLKPHPQNPRIHTEKQVGQIAQSIEAFGFNVPILVDDRRNVVAGHGRLLAARKLGWSTVPVIKLNHLSESQYSAFLIADNRLTENSSWMNDC